MRSSQNRRQLIPTARETRRSGTLIVTFAIAVAGVNAGWVIFMLLIQIAASIWYSASYIPYGRRMIIKIFQSTCFKPCPKVCDPCIKIAT